MCTLSATRARFALLASSALRADVRRSRCSSHIGQVTRALYVGNLSHSMHAYADALSATLLTPWHTFDYTTTQGNHTPCFFALSAADNHNMAMRMPCLRQIARLSTVVSAHSYSYGDLVQLQAHYRRLIIQCVSVQCRHHGNNSAELVGPYETVP